MTPQEHYGRIPREYVVSGAALRDCTDTERFVYLIIAAHAGENFHAFPGIDLIAEAIGKSDRTVSRAVTELVKKGHLTADRRGGKGNSSRYWLTSNSETLDDTLSSPKHDSLAVTLSSPKDDSLDVIPRPSKGDNAEPKGDALKPNGDTQHVTRKGKGKNNASSSDVFLALQKAGVTGKALSELSKLDDLDAADVRSVFRRAAAKASDNPAGLLVRMLQDGERTNEEDRAAKQRELKREAAVLAAKDALKALPDPTHEQLRDARAWRDTIDRSRIYFIAKQVCPGLFVDGSWIAEPYENERLLVACCQWAFENSMCDMKIISDLRASTSRLERHDAEPEEKGIDQKAHQTEVSNLQN